MKTYAFRHQRNNQVAIDNIKELWKFFGSRKVFSQEKIVEEINDDLIA